MVNKLMAVRAEYGEPFVDVVKGFAEMGYSRTATAEVLEFNLSYFRQLLKRFKLQAHFKDQCEMRRECRSSGGTGRVKGSRYPRENVYTDEYLLAQVRHIPSYSMFRCVGNVDATTIQNRFGSWSKARELAGVPYRRGHESCTL